MKALNLVGQKSGKLTVVGFSHTANEKRWWKCICDCGKETIKTSFAINKQKVRSCGCLATEIHTSRLKKHGYAKTPTYTSWVSMKHRCSNPNHINYNRYGGAGIKVCKEWVDSFEAFLKDMGERPKNMTLDRINNSLGYFKENCRWATKSQQNANQHHPKKPGRGKKILFNGEEKTVKEWSEILNIPVPTLTKRLKREPTVERAFEKRRLSANQWFRVE